MNRTGKGLRAYGNICKEVFSRAENFWNPLQAPSDFPSLIRYSALMSLFALSGYLLYYNLIGTIWSWWPWVQTTIPPLRGFMCALLQWVFFTTFPVLSGLFIEGIFFPLRPPE